MLEVIAGFLSIAFGAFLVFCYVLPDEAGLAIWNLCRLLVGLARGRTLAEIFPPPPPPGEEVIEIPRWLVGAVCGVLAALPIGLLVWAVWRSGSRPDGPLRAQRLDTAAAELIEAAKSERVLGVLGRVRLYDEGSHVRTGDRRFESSVHLEAMRTMIEQGVLVPKGENGYALSPLGKERVEAGRLLDP